MVNKKIILVIAAVILVIIGVMIINKKLEGGIAENVTFGDGCAIDEDCEDSFKTCKDRVVSCENGCVYGRCTKCVPVCPEETECGNITCLDSARICPDGRIARCANYCDPNTGKCTLCTPQCNITIEDRVNYQSKAGKFIFDAVPCVDINYTERKEIRLVKKEMKKIKLPKGYSTVIEPFSVNKDGPLDLTLSIPETYSDVKALKCREQECNPVLVKYATELRCGGKIAQEFLRKEEHLEPRLMPIKIKETRFNITADEGIMSGKYKVRFKNNSEDLSVTLAMPKEAVEEAKNPSLKITGTPLVIEIKGEVKDNVNAIVTMPYTSLEGFEEDSVGMYIKIKDGWKYVEGEINKEERIVTAIISNVNKYIKDEIELALMGVFCISCYRSSFTKVYQPGKGSKTSVILIHGFNPEPNTYQELIDDIKLTNQPFEVWTFDYPLSNLIEESMDELMSLLEKNHAAYENIYIVGHSLGGIIAQQALYNSYLENKRSLENKEPPAYNYLGKVRKVILVGTSNEGSPVVEVYRRLFGDLVNSKEHALFNPKSKVINDLAKGMITPRVPAIDYKVIAGTKTYEFNLVFFRLTTEKLADIYEKNDGIITVKSAQNIGGEYIDNQCEDYWEVNLTHTELIDDLLARRIIGRIIAGDISKDDTALPGHNKYFDLSVRDNLAGDMYVIIGKKIIEEEVVDETGCKCGNGFCGEGENEINCPSDCARFLSREKRNWLFALAVILAVSVIGFQYIKYKRFSHPHLKMMVKHIKTNYEIIASKGYTHKQMKDAFLSRGWPKRTVNDTIELLRKEFHHHYHKPLKKHLKKHLKKGYRGEEIKRALIDAGWEGEVVEKVFRGEELEPTFKLKHKYKDKPKGKRMYFWFNR